MESRQARQAFFALVAIVFLMLVAVSRPALAASRDPFALIEWRTQNDGLNRPWLDPTCYDDDHVGLGHAAGWLTAGQSWTFSSPLEICSDKILRGMLVHAKRLDGELTVTDWVGHSAPGRLWQSSKGTIYWAACNSDIHTDREIDLEDDERGYASWAVTANATGYYWLEMIMNEPWWQGGESSVNWCLATHDF